MMQGPGLCRLDPGMVGRWSVASRSLVGGGEAAGPCRRGVQLRHPVQRVAMLVLDLPAPVMRAAVAQPEEATTLRRLVKGRSRQGRSELAVSRGQARLDASRRHGVRHDRLHAELVERADEEQVGLAEEIVRADDGRQHPLVDAVFAYARYQDPEIQVLVVAAGDDLGLAQGEQREARDLVADGIPGLGFYVIEIGGGGSLQAKHRYDPGAGKQAPSCPPRVMRENARIDLVDAQCRSAERRLERVPVIAPLR